MTGFGAVVHWVGLGAGGHRLLGGLLSEGDVLQWRVCWLGGGVVRVAGAQEGWQAAWAGSLRPIGTAGQTG